jgi:diketogulonate reductase-like aldo/keto reductase
MNVKKGYEMSNGVKIPSIGFGTWQIPNGEEAYQATLWALKAGYRHFDTAAAYGNEESVGKAIKDSGLKREEIFITFKLKAELKGYEIAKTEFAKTI